MRDLFFFPQFIDKFRGENLKYSVEYFKFRQSSYYPSDDKLYMMTNFSSFLLIWEREIETGEFSTFTVCTLAFSERDRLLVDISYFLQRLEKTKEVW